MRPTPFSTPLVVSLASIAVAVVVCGWQVPALLEAAFPSNLDRDSTASRLAGYLEAHEDDASLYQARFNGRSAFFRPKPPRKERVIVQRPAEPKETPPKRDPLPAIYTGPKVAFVIGQEVYFSGGLHLRVGEENQGVTVVATDAPWSVTLRQHDQDHEIAIFKRTTNGLGSSARSGRYPPGLKIVESTELAKKPDEATGEQTQRQRQ